MKRLFILNEAYIDSAPVQYSWEKSVFIYCTECSVIYARLPVVEGNSYWMAKPGCCEKCESRLITPPGGIWMSANRDELQGFPPKVLKRELLLYIKDWEKTKNG